MEGRMKNHSSQVSPERAKVWREKSPKYYYNYEKYNQQKHHQQQHHGNGKAPVIYYLCRNGQLEHPHFMEVALSSIDRLYLRDVIERLNVLRGRGMASMYSWSCKRSHKGGYVWHDLSVDDLLIPVHGNEYVLKGVELFEESNPGCFSPMEPRLLQNQKALPEPPSSSSRSQEDSSSSSSSLNGVNTTNSHDDETSPTRRLPSSSSPDSGKTSWNGSLSLTEYKVYKTDGLSDASTQTEEKPSKTIKDSLQPENDNANQNRISRIKSTPDNSRRSVPSPLPSTPSTSSSGRTDTSESLTRPNARKLNSFRILEEEEVRLRPSSRFKASDMLLQLVSCGSISVKDRYRFGLVPTYKPKFLHAEFLSREAFSTTSLMSEEIDFSKDNNPHLKGVRLREERDYFSGSLVETSMVKEGLPAFKRSSSYNDERSTRKVDSIKDKEPCNGHGMRLTDAAVKPVLVEEDKENVIKIEERLASGARVIIQSKVSVENGAFS